MALSDYASLQAAVKDWAVRFDSTTAARVVDFIRLGEERIWRTVRLSWGISLPTVLTIPAGANYVALPSDWLEFTRLSIPGVENLLEYMSPDQIEDLPVGGNAMLYSVEGGRLIYGQTPQANVSITAKYYKHPGLLETVGTTWLLTRAPSIYLYAALLELSIFVKNPTKVAEFGSLLDKAIDAEHSADKVAQFSGSRLRYRR